MAAWARHDAKLVCGEHMEAMLADESRLSVSSNVAVRDITPAAEEQADLEQGA
jgi:hypothetical protein